MDSDDEIDDPGKLATATTALERPGLAGGGPGVPSLELDLAQARAAAALFGDAAAVKVGRYALIERAGAGGMGVVWSAWDPELGRGVAIKLASSGDAAARARARDEGRALARLSHPNVVPIYDVLEHDDRVFLVMELVKGRTLRAAAAEQTVAQIVRCYRQAGDGLAAAHHAGLIHRDFKPDNAILGADGRVRVLDFGLAHDSGLDPGTIAGTPRYMAPEQHAGAPLTAAVDQYALCVALRETVAGKGPVPRWLAPILARGAAEQAGDRYPSMDELVRALGRDPVWRWKRRALIGGGALVAVGLVGAWSLGRAQQAETPCVGGPALIAPAWGDGKRAAAATHLATLTTAYAADGVPRVLGALDDYRRGWLALHRSTCVAHRRGEISAQLLDRRGACLDRRRAALAAIGELTATVAAEALPDLVTAAGKLPAIDGCADDEALLAPIEPPPPGAALEVATIDDLLAKVDVERDAARIADAAHDAAVALARATALGYRPLLARARLAHGRVALTGERGDFGADDFAAATRDAIAVGDDPLAIEAYARRAFAITRTADQVPAPDGLELIVALGERAGDRGRFARALLHNNLGAVARARGDLEAARAEYAKARAAAAMVHGDGAIELTAVLTSMLQLVDDPAARAQLAADVIATRTRALGAHHPLTLQARLQAAASLDDPGALVGALVPALTDLAHYVPALGRTITGFGFEVLAPATLAGDHATVRAIAELMIAAESAGGHPEDVAVARAYRALVSGEVAAARAAFAAILAARADDATRGWSERKRTADLTLGAALAALTAGDRPAALRALDDAAAIYDAIAAQMPGPSRHQRAATVSALRARLAG